MSEKYYLLLYDTSTHAERCMPLLVVAGISKGRISHGVNGLFYRENGLLVRELLCRDGTYSNFASFDYDFCYLTPEQRQAAQAASGRLQELVGLLPAADRPMPPVSGIAPTAIVVVREGRARIFHYAQQGVAGALFLMYHECEWPGADEWASLEQVLLEGNPRLTLVRPLLN